MLLENGIAVSLHTFDKPSAVPTRADLYVRNHAIEITNRNKPKVLSEILDKVAP